MTAPEASVVELFIGPDALRVDVWDQYSIRVSMLEVGSAWTFSFWYSDRARASWQLLTDPDRGVKLGQLVTVSIDGDAVLSGIVETRAVGDTQRSSGRTPPAFVISGRDELGGAVSFDADPTLTLPGRMLEDALAALYDGVGIIAEVSESVPPDARAGLLRTPRRGSSARRVSRRQLVATKHPRIGEKVQSVVSRIVRGLGLRVWTTPAEASGRTAVVVDRPRSTGEPLFSLLREMEDGRISDRSTIWAGTETSSIRDVPTEVTVFADAPRGDAAASKIARTVTNGFLLTPEALSRVDVNAPARPRYVESRQARDVTAAHNEASRICAEANEAFRTTTYSVLGHRQNGRLWTPNNLVSVRDDLVRIDETMLVTSCEYTGSRSDAQRTELGLVPRGALTEIPETP